MRFTDAHAAGAVCIPSRYGLLTGCYPWRNQGNRNPAKGPLIDPERMTLASLLRGQGYATAMIGKWHLGFVRGDQFDYPQPLRGGPVDRGFDSFFGQHASLDIPPYFFIENDRCVAPASGKIDAHNSPDWSPVQGAFWRAGGIAPGFKHEEVLPAYTRKAVEYLADRGRRAADKPFFLYLALTGPHTPWLPDGKFRGTSQAGLYGDFVAQVDDSVGQVLAALDRARLAGDTLVFFTSDNGPVWYPENVRKFGHASVGPLRGMKGDAWEGGHRMPFIVRWPGKIKPGSVSAETVCFTDVLATLAQIVGAKIPANAGEDSISLLPLLRGEPRAGPLRAASIFESSKGVLAIRQGDWKLIPSSGSGGFSKSADEKTKSAGPAGQLYNLAADLGEQKNLYAEQPDKVKELSALLDKLKQAGRSAPNP